jgi:putative ABC transport system permease protein
MLWNSIQLALSSIRRSVLRSILTILGIVIGVAAVITMVTIGTGATLQVKQQISSMGSNLLMIVPGKRLGPGQSSDTKPFKVADAEAIAKNVGSVNAVAPVSNSSLQAIYGNQNWSTQVVGSANEYFRITNRSIRSGRQFTDSEQRGGAAVCVIGETVRKKLFGAQDPVGDRMRLQKLSCEVIGLLLEKGQNTMGSDQDDIVVIPLKTFQRRISGTQDVGMLQVSIQSELLTDKAKADIVTLMRERRHLSASDDDNFNVMDPKEITRMLTGTTTLLTALLSAVAAVSLLVGGIGIMNIMLVSVTERTREIGIRLAIGAIEGQVMTQFLVEAVVLSSLGGIIGIILGGVGSFALAHLMKVPYVFTPGINILAFLFSALIGVIFGYFPARRAASLDPIDALRHE